MHDQIHDDLSNEKVLNWHFLEKILSLKKKKKNPLHKQAPPPTLNQPTKRNLQCPSMHLMRYQAFCLSEDKSTKKGKKKRKKERPDHEIESSRPLSQYSNTDFL